MTSRIGRLYLDQRVGETPLPKMRTHAQWCTWLFGRGSLDVKHRRCMDATCCLATTFKRTDVSWRKRA